MSKNIDLEQYYEKTIKVCEEALRLNQSFDSYNKLGDAYCNAGNYPQAIINYSQALNFSNEPLILAEIYSKIGEVYHDLEDYNQAIFSYSEALKLQPESDIYLTTRSDLYLKIGNYQNAIEDYKRAIELHPASYMYSNLADIFKKQWYIANVGGVSYEEEKKDGEPQRDNQENSRPVVRQILPSFYVESQLPSTPDILADIVDFDRTCRKQEKVLFRAICHELYNVKENRPIMDIAAWKAINGAPKLSIRATKGGDVSALGGRKDSAGEAEGGTGTIYIALDINNKADSACTSIHEMMHLVITVIAQNKFKAYKKGQKSDYVKIINASKEAEMMALTDKEQHAVSAMLLPYNAPSYEERHGKAWKEERIAVITELCTASGYDVVKRIYDRELAYFEEILEECQIFLEKERWQPRPYVLHVAAAVVSTEETVNRANIAKAISWRAQYKKFGTLRLQVKDGDKIFDQILQILIDNKNPTDQLLEKLYKDGNKKALEDFCNACAKVCESAFIITKGGFCGTKKTYRFDEEKFDKKLLAKTVEKEAAKLQPLIKSVEELFPSGKVSMANAGEVAIKQIGSRE
ncbi:MAG: hypothetical protein K0R25_1109 [Rickettsiaceae bacterium]|jgi:tetratricopeptide (TPR) repeat protein|nr:hypothetical protein [Rickettsiaceae bacterium]